MVNLVNSGKYFLFLTWGIFSGVLFGQVVPDSIPLLSLPDSALIAGDSIPPVTDPRSILIDSLKASSDLKSQVRYKARDSIIFDVVHDMLYLYGAVHIEYEEMTLDAEVVRLDWSKHTLYAEGVPDSTGKLSGTPVFSEGENKYTAREMTYNFKSEKGRIIGARTQDGDGYILAETVKRQPDESFHAKNARYTTCNLEEPHFYIQSKKLKVIPDKQIISGPLNLVIEDFPIPIVVPFGFFPTQKGKRSGIVLPQYGEAADRGFFLRNMGYYFGGNDYFDLLLEGDIYTRGGWRLGAVSRYNKLNRFNGSLSVEYGVIRFGERADPDFSRTNSWFVRWNHRQNINPNTSLTGDMNFDSKQYLREFSFDLNDRFTNDLRSSLAFSKRFANTPFSLNASINYSQSLNENTISLKLPELNFYMATQYPFKNLKVRKGVDWLKKLSLSYTMNAKNEITQFPDSLFIPVIFRPRNPLDVITDVIRDTIVIDTIIRDGTIILQEREVTDTIPTVTMITPGDFYRNGMTHVIPIQTNIRILKFINITPRFNYREYWYSKTIRRFQDPLTGVVETQDVNGFATARSFDTGVSATTNFYGIFAFKGRKGVAIRQRISPTIGYSFKPDFSTANWGFYDAYTDTTGKEIRYNRFERGVYGSPTANENQNLTFGLTQVFEMKVRKKESFAPEFDENQEKYNRFTLLDNLSLNGSYNFAADSFQLSNIGLAARTNLFNGKLNINANATLDPYALNAEGKRINVLQWTQERGLGRITNATVSLSTSFRSKRGGDKQETGNTVKEEFDEIMAYRDAYVDFDIPWSLAFNYNLTFRKTGLKATDVIQTTRITGDLNVTPKWKIGFTSGFDLKELEVTTTSVSIFRDLHCWEMSLNWVPFGSLQSFSMTINVKSSTLQDLRLSKRNNWQDRFRMF